MQVSRLIRAEVRRDLSVLSQPASFVTAGRFIQKSSVNPIAVSELVASFNDVVGEFLALFIEASIFARAEGFHVVPDGTALLPAAMNPEMSWTGEGKPLRASRFDLDQHVLRALPKFGGVVPVNREAANRGGQAFETLVQNLSMSAGNEALNAALLDPTNDGTGESPKAITNGREVGTSSGDLWADLQTLREDFKGDPVRSIVVTDPDTVVDIESYLGSRGQLWPEHVELIGVRGSPRDSSGGQLAYLDPAAVAATFGEVLFDSTENATIQLDDAPDAPASASTVMVSGFQQNILFYRLRVHANWHLMFPNAVRVVTGCLYMPQ